MHLSDAFQAFANILQAADDSIGNLECVIAEMGVAEQKRHFSPNARRSCSIIVLVLNEMVLVLAFDFVIPDRVRVPSKADYEYEKPGFLARNRIERTGDPQGAPHPDLQAKSPCGRRGDNTILMRNQNFLRSD